MLNRIIEGFCLAFFLPKRLSILVLYLMIECKNAMLNRIMPRLLLYSTTTTSCKTPMCYYFIFFVLSLSLIKD